MEEALSVLPYEEHSKETRSQGDRLPVCIMSSLGRERTKAAHFRDALEWKERRAMLLNIVIVPKI